MPKDEVLYNPEHHGALLTPEAAQAHLKERHGIRLGLQRMADLRSAGGGPRFLKPTSREVRYPERLLDAWAVERNRKPLLDFVPIKPEREAALTEDK